MATMTIKDVDAELERIMALSEADLVDEIIALGLDPHEEAEKTREAFRRAIAAVKERRRRLYASPLP